MVRRGREVTKQGRISMATRKELTEAIGVRYRGASQPRLCGVPVEADHRIDRLGRMAPLQQAQVADVYERPFDVQQGMLLAQGRIERPQVDLPDDAVEGTLAIERHQSRALPLRPRPRPQRQQCARRVAGKRGQNGQRFEVRLGGFAGLVRGWQVALEQAPQRSRPMIVEIEDAQRVLVVGGWRHLNLSGGKLACAANPTTVPTKKIRKQLPAK